MTETADQITVKLTECLAVLDELQAHLAAAHLQAAIDTLRLETVSKRIDE